LAVTYYNINASEKRTKPSCPKQLRWHMDLYVKGKHEIQVIEGGYGQEAGGKQTK
jgi:hypothetical protein